MCLPLALRTCGIGLLSLVAIFLSGCGRSGDVSGKVRFMGSSLASGSLTFHYQDIQHSPVSGFIRSDGTYRISGCTPGEVRVTVHAQLGRWKKSDSPNIPAIPIRYADADQTDILVTVEKGRQEIDINLEL